MYMCGGLTPRKTSVASHGLLDFLRRGDLKTPRPTGLLSTLTVCLTWGAAFGESGRVVGSHHCPPASGLFFLLSCHELSVCWFSNYEVLFLVELPSLTVVALCIRVRTAVSGDSIVGRLVGAWSLRRRGALPSGAGHHPDTPHHHLTSDCLYPIFSSSLWSLSEAVAGEAVD